MYTLLHVSTICMVESTVEKCTSLNNQVLYDSIFNKLRPRYNAKFLPKGVNAGPLCAAKQKLSERVWPRYDRKSR